MRKRYIILLSNIFAQRDWDRFGCDYFRQRGYEVMAVELADLLRPGLRGDMEHDGFKSLDAVRSIVTIEDMDALAAEFGPGDLIVNNVLLDAGSAPVYWALSRHQVKYVALYLNSLPTGW